MDGNLAALDKYMEEQHQDEPICAECGNETYDFDVCDTCGSDNIITRSEYNYMKKVELAEMQREEARDEALLEDMEY